MADTEKQNFRYPGDRWREAQTKLAEMRAAGYDIDMTKVLSNAVDRIRCSTFEEIAAPFSLTPGEKPAPVWRKPFARAEADQ